MADTSTRYGIGNDAIRVKVFDNGDGTYSEGVKLTGSNVEIVKVKDNVTVTAGSDTFVTLFDLSKCDSYRVLIKERNNENKKYSVAEYYANVISGWTIGHGARALLVSDGSTVIGADESGIDGLGDGGSLHLKNPKQAVSKKYDTIVSPVYFRFRNHDTSDTIIDMYIIKHSHRGLN